MLPKSAADQPAGKLTVRTAGGGRQSFRLSLQGRNGRLALNTAGAPRVLMRRGQIDVGRLPARTGIVGLELTGRLPTAGKGRRVKLRARVVGAEGSEALTRELRGSRRR